MERKKVPRRKTDKGKSAKQMDKIRKECFVMNVIYMKSKQTTWKD